MLKWTHECRSAVKSLGHNHDGLHLPCQCFRPPYYLQEMNAGIRITLMNALCFLLSPHEVETVKQSKHRKAAIMNPETSSPAKVCHADGSQGRTTPARPTERDFMIAARPWRIRPSTCYDSLVFLRLDSSQESWWEMHKSSSWRHSHLIWHTETEAEACDLQQGAVLHENKDWPLANECVFHRGSSRPDLQGFTVNAVWPRCQL